MLVDGFHRVHDYLRVSITDRCNLRCSYCMWDLVSTIRALATRPRGGFQPRGLERRSGMAPEPQMSVTSSGGEVAAWRGGPPERREGT